MLYIGRPTCGTCQLFIPLLDSVLKKENLDIYYFNTDEYNKDEYRPLFKKWNINFVPSVLKLNGNNTYIRMKTYHPETAISMWINAEKTIKPKVEI